MRCCGLLVDGWVGCVPDAEGSEKPFSFAFLRPSIDGVPPKELGE